MTFEDWPIMASFDGVSIGLRYNYSVTKSPECEDSAVIVMSEDGEIVWETSFESCQLAVVYFVVLIRETMRHEYADAAAAQGLNIDDIITEREEKATTTLKEKFFPLNY